MMNPFFVLLPSNVPVENLLCRPLLGHRKGRPDLLPWLAIATGYSNGSYDLVERNTDESQAKSLIAQAETSANQFSVEWQVAEQSGFLFFKKPSLARAIVKEPAVSDDIMDDRSAEIIASPDALRNASAVLKSDDLIITIPKRGWLMAAPGLAGEFPKMMKMHEIGSGVFGRAGDDQICPYGFFVKSGELTGANVIEDGGGFMHLAAPVASEWFTS